MYIYMMQVGLHCEEIQMEMIIDPSVLRKIKYFELLHKGHIVLVYIALYWYHCTLLV